MFCFIFSPCSPALNPCSFCCAKDGRCPGRSRPILESSAMRAERLQKASKRKLRKLSGWNVFQKQQLEGGAFSTEEYSKKIKLISREWDQLPLDDKQGFEVEAQHQQELRAKLAFIPLSVGTSARIPTELERKVGRNCCKKLAARRLKLNEKLFEQHSIWSLPTCFGDSRSNKHRVRFLI